MSTRSSSARHTFTTPDLKLRLHTKASVTIQHEEVALYGSCTILTLPGAGAVQLTRQLIPLLDGSATREDILSGLEQSRRPDAAEFLDLLMQLGLLDALSGADRDLPEVVFRQRRLEAVLSRSGRAEMLLNAAIVVVGTSSWALATVRDLAESGLRRIHVVEDPKMKPDGLQAYLKGVGKTAPWCELSSGSWDSIAEGKLGLPAWSMVLNLAPADDNAAQRQTARRLRNGVGCPILSASVLGLELSLGPLDPNLDGGPCWHCAYTRWLATQNPFGRSHPSRPELTSCEAERFSLSTAPGPAAALSGATIAMEVVKILSLDGSPELVGKLQVQNLLTGSRITHTILPLPHCKICGGADAKHPTFKTKISQSWSTFEEFSHGLPGLIDARIGPISHFGLRSEQFEGPPFFAWTLLSHLTNGTEWLGVRESCGGKGYRKVDAFISAIGEAVERYSASFVPIARLHEGPIAELVGPAIDPRDLCLFDRAQYERPDFPFVPFDPDRSNQWVRGTSLGEGEPVWLPAATVYYSDIPGEGQNFWQVTSNGLASGPDVDFATLGAVFELFERDAMMTSWACRLPGKRVIVDATVDADTERTLALLSDLGADIEIYLLELDSPVVTAACFAYGDGVRWPGLTVGSAGHLCARTAIRNAVLEQAYSGLSCRRIMQEGSRPLPEAHQVRTFLDHALYYIRPERQNNADFMRASKSIPLSTLPPVASPDVDDLAQSLSRSGHRVAIANVTSPDLAGFPFTVVRALGAQLQPLTCGFGLDRALGERATQYLTRPRNPALHPMC